MELDQSQVVTLAELARLAFEAGTGLDERGVRKLAYRLQELGWLGSLRTKGAWEFIPGARAGAYGSGDRFVEFRAQLALNPGWPGVLAMESAATVLGLAQHLPRREVVALPDGVALPKAMDDWRRVGLDLPLTGRETRSDLPTWSIEGLIAGVAAKPSGYRDLAGLAQWLPEAGPRLRESELMACLAGATEASWQRAAYLARIAGAGGVAEALLAARPPRHSAWFGPRRAGGVYDPAAKIGDAVLARYLQGGTGA
jgi:hypothetical protein